MWVCAATVTPFGGLPLIDYRVATSQRWRGAHASCALSAFCRGSIRFRPARGRRPDRVLLEGPDTPFSAEFTVTITCCFAVRKRTADFMPPTRALCHKPDDVAEIATGARSPVTQGVLGRVGLSREMCQFPAPASRPRLGRLLQRQADEAIAAFRLGRCGAGCARRLASPVGGGDTRIRQSLGLRDVRAVATAASGSGGCLVPAIARSGKEGRS